MADNNATTVTRKAEPFSRFDPNVLALELSRGSESLSKLPGTSKAALEAPEPNTTIESNPELTFDALKENTIVNIVRQSVSPLPHATPGVDTKYVHPPETSSDDETSRQSYDRTAQNPVLTDNLMLSDGPPDKDGASSPQENIGVNKEFYEGCLNSPQFSFNLKETLMVKSEITQASESLIAGTTHQEDSIIGTSPSFIQSATAYDDDINDDNILDRGEEELQQMLSPSCDSGSFDWRDETSPIIQKSYKSKRRSSLFLAHLHRPSTRLLETPSPGKTSPQKTPTRRSSVEDDNYDENATDFFNQLEEPTESASSHDSLTPGLQPTTSPTCEDNEDHEFFDGSLSELEREDFLESIHEETSENQSSNLTKVSEMEINSKRLELENSRLRESLQSKTRSYDFQIGPFRHAFETVSKQEV